MSGSGAPGTRSITVTSCEALDTLPPDAAALFGGDFFSTLAWYRTVLEAAMPDGAAPLFLLASEAGRALAVFPLRRLADGAIEGLTTPYTALHHPLLAPGLDAATLRRVGRAFGEFCRSWATVRIDALPPEWPPLVLLLAGMRAALMPPRRFDHFGNWHLDVRGMDWPAYLATRPGQLRETIRRREGRLRAAGAEFRLYASQDDGLEEGLAAYEAVYARSWKEPEPYPGFNPALMRACAAEGTLRLAVLRMGAEVWAAQFWVRRGGWASVLKLAHDEAAKSFSPGTVLTAWTLQSLFAEGELTEIDFGRGDDPYKQLWTDTRRPRIGIVLANPLRPAGAMELARVVVSRLRGR